jgi:hypothetical protein
LTTCKTYGCLPRGVLDKTTARFGWTEYSDFHFGLDKKRIWNSYKRILSKLSHLKQHALFGVGWACLWQDDQTDLADMLRSCADE